MEVFVLNVSKARRHFLLNMSQKPRLKVKRERTIVPETCLNTQTPYLKKAITDLNIRVLDTRTKWIFTGP